MTRGLGQARSAWQQSLSFWKAEPQAVADVAIVGGGMVGAALACALGMSLSVGCSCCSATWLVHTHGPLQVTTQSLQPSKWCSSTSR